MSFTNREWWAEQNKPRGLSSSSRLLGRRSDAGGEVAGGPDGEHRPATESVAGWVGHRTGRWIVVRERAAVLEGSLA
jgi:hypothetical protein